MTTKRFIQLCIYLLAGSSFIWSTGNCLIGDSVSNQVVDSSNPSSNSRNAKAFSPTKQFLMQSYYGRYASLHDSDFENFMSQEVTSGLCEVLPENHDSILRLSVLRRDLVGEVIERLPSGVFADPFELQHLAQRGVFNDIAVFGDTNLELPSFLSNRSAVEIHLDVDPNTLSQPTDFSIEFPLHARYQPLNESGYSIVEFGAPDMLLRCSTKEKAENSNCLFKLKNDDANLSNVGLVWRIPSGKKAHSDLVSTVTFLIAFLSTLVILVTSLHYFNSRVSKDLKQSRISPKPNLEPETNRHNVPPTFIENKPFPNSDDLYNDLLSLPDSGGQRLDVKLAWSSSWVRARQFEDCKLTLTESDVIKSFLIHTNLDLYHRNQLLKPVLMLS
ncbi:phosphatidylinositol-glycan biosynthesis class X protein [Trifolium repens]|nr:phosphatidylinositol-glycan biosynthesis class X protein [Trifolium repens]